MTHDELLAKINNNRSFCEHFDDDPNSSALRAVVELHKPEGKCSDPNCKPLCDWCSCGVDAYPCPTIQAIEEELK